mmetsp:Transcript_2791/g.8712  ORF Transcript_2791/g.8712 Transcript_2791/m.8712 type:complete len:237 (+) Transcript_2791:1962-2672(+)
MWIIPPSSCVLPVLHLPASQAAASTSSRCAARSEAAIDFAGSQPGRPAHADSSKPSTAAGPQTGGGRPSSSCTSTSLARSESSSTVHGGDPESRGLSSTSSTDQRSERRLTGAICCSCSSRSAVPRSRSRAREKRTYSEAAPGSAEGGRALSARPAPRGEPVPPGRVCQSGGQRMTPTGGAGQSARPAPARVTRTRSTPPPPPSSTTPSAGDAPVEGEASPAAGGGAGSASATACR